MVSSPKACPACLVTAPSSGSGKTTITAALARRYRNEGKKVCVFKVGPDFLDPMILERASGAPVYQLDLWMVGEDGCRDFLYNAAGDADLILIEGVMGLFDGVPSSADIAEIFGIPVVAVIDATAMAQSFGAVAHGLATLRPEISFAGVIGNRVGGERHVATLTELLPESIRFLGALPREKEQTLPGRHLGLVQADEIEDLDRRLDRAAENIITAGIDLPMEPVEFLPGNGNKVPVLLEGIKIAVADDRSFSFIYKANLDLLISMGAELIKFSPLADVKIPKADACYLPGGYPELNIKRIEANRQMATDLKAFIESGRPMVAECGGMLALLDTLTDADGNNGAMAGVIPGSATMQKRLANLGLHFVELPEGSMRGHTFHHSLMESKLEPIAVSSSVRPGGKGEPVFRYRRLTASYLHFYFSSNPQTTAALFRGSIE